MILSKLITCVVFCFYLIFGCRLLGQGAAKLPPPSGVAVFTIVFEARATDTDGTSASSKVEVRFAPGADWHGYFGTNFGSFGRPAEDTRTPSGLYKLRGGLFGLRPDEPMCFGILSHKGSASAGGRTISGPGSNQHSSSGNDWSLREDAARFTRTKDGGVLRCAPVVYQEEEPPEFGLLGPGAYDFDQAGKDQYEKLMNFRFTNAELKNLKNVKKVNEASLTSTDGTIQQWFKCTLTGEPPEDETEVSVEPEDYDGWIPEGNFEKPGERGNRLKIQVKVAKKDEPDKRRKAKITFTFKKIGKQPGVCINWPKTGAGSDYDLKIRQEDNTDLEVLGPDEARTKELVEEATLVVSCYDYGAYGTLVITAKDEDGKDLKVKVRGKETTELAIPLDDNANHIADAWERQNGVVGYPDNWDDAGASGQRTKGDGLSLFEKYRGVVVLEGGQRKWTRLVPRQKVLFILDEDDMVLLDAWKKAADIHLYLLSEEMAEGSAGSEASRRVNHRLSDFRNGDKYAVVMTKKPTNDAEAIATQSGGVDMGETSIGNSPKDIQYCRVFPDHIRGWILMLRNKVKNAIANAGTPNEGPLSKRFPKWLLEKAYARLQDPGTVESLYQQGLHTTAIHELGHACGLPGHVDGSGTEAPTGERSCFTCYATQDENRIYIVLEALFRPDALLPLSSGIFCTPGAAGGFDCHGKLNVKDN